MIKLLLATNNKHKLIEFEHKFNDFNIEYKLMSLSDVTDEKIDIEETEITLEGNARLKSRFIYERFNITTIADDTGLEVFELNNDPGVFSARYSGIHGDDKANRMKLLNELKFSIDRRARFRTVICLSNKTDDYIIEGICTGKISTSESGDNGFGYDSIFIPDGYEKTFAELDLNVKNQISHRANAINNLINFLNSNQL